MSQLIQKIGKSEVQEGIQKATIVTKRLKISSKCERSDSLYETVIQKNFQTINELLRKLNTIISKHEEFEYEMTNYTKRLSKIQADMESIHNQHRRDNLHIFSNIEDLKYQLNGIDSHIKMIYDNYKNKGFAALAKNQRISARVLQGSQRCESQEEEITEQPILSKDILDNIGASIQTDNINLKKNQTTQKVGSKMPRTETQESKTPLDQNKSYSKLHQNITPSSKLIAETNLKRKITIQKKQQLRQSLQEKCQNINNRIGHQQKGLKQNQFRSENNNRQITSEQNITPKQSQISWNLQRFLSAISNSNQQKSQKQKIQAMRNSLLSHQRNSRQVLSFIQQNFASSKQSGQKNRMTTQQLQQCLKICLHDQKIKDIQKRIGQIFLKNLETEKDLNNLSEKIKQIYQKCSTYVTIPKLSEEFYTITKDLNKLRTYCHQNFAHKGQTKKAFLFIQNKVKNIQSVAENPKNTNEISVIVSKCLGCNRAASFGHETTLKGSYWGNSCAENSQQKIKGIKQLKKRTFQIVKNEKKRPFSKYERTNGI